MAAVPLPQSVDSEELGRALREDFLVAAMKKLIS
jgi:hypothetical protein